jgi:hypothetical protein
MVGLYLIVSSYDLDDSMIDLDELLGITGAIILVDVSVLELFKPDNLPERGSLSTETAPPWWSDISHWRTSWRCR